MARWLVRGVVTAVVALLVGCSAPTSPSSPPGPGPSPTAPSASSQQGTTQGTTPASVDSYLTSLRSGDLAGALASADDTGESPAGADTANNVYQFLGSGPIRLQDWRLAGVTPADDGGQWVFVVCQLSLADGSARELPLTFHTNKVGKLVFVG